jgi:murein tripeptide amidase MpaA
VNKYTRHTRQSADQSRQQAGRAALWRGGLLVFALLLLALLAASTALAQESTPTPLPAETSLVVRIRAETFEQARALSQMGLDLLSRRDGDDLFAIVTPAQQADLLAAGWDVRPDAQQTALLRRRSPQTFQQGYATVEEIEQFLQAQADAYPNLTTLVDFGDSWERLQSGGAAGYNLWALRLTNKDIPGPKPVFFLMATIHAREISTPEIARRFIDYLLSSYGSDAEATWLLDEHEIVVVPMVNPDGHKLAERGYMQRKNTNISYGGNCSVPPASSDHFGVDLNRNFAYRWGAVVPPSFSPCSATFPGGFPASEPETQALQNFITSLYPDHPRPADGTPAPEDTSGVLITLHSYSNLVLWPWGHTSAPAPNGPQLAQLGRRMAAFNGYEPAQSIELYPTSGTTDDWSYATLGIASYTFEIGPFLGECGGFMPPFSCLDEGDDGRFWQRNLPALLYAARVARAPYQAPAGPDLALAGTTMLTGSTTLSLTIALESSTVPLSATELYIGAAPERGAVPVPLRPIDGAAGAATEAPRFWFAELPRARLAAACDSAQAGRINTCRAAAEPVLLLRGQDDVGAWGPLQAIWPQATLPITSTPEPLCRDTFEPDNARANASELALSAPGAPDSDSWRTLCPAGDDDWLVFRAEQGQSYSIALQDTTSSLAGLSLALFDEAGNRLRAVSPVQDTGGSLQMAAWTAPASGRYYIRVQDAANQGGAAQTYAISLRRAWRVLLPLIQR